MVLLSYHNLIKKIYTKHIVQNIILDKVMSELVPEELGEIKQRVYKYSWPENNFSRV